MTAKLQTTFIINFGAGNLPGQAGNQVGFAATPAAAPGTTALPGGVTWPGAYPGTLTTWPGSNSLTNANSAAFANGGGAGTSGSPYVFKFYIFPVGANIANTNGVFIGCQFASNSVSGSNVFINGGNLWFFYCSATPKPSLATAPPNAAWPSAGAGQNIFVTYAGYSSYMLNGNNGYQFGSDTTSVTGQIPGSLRHMGFRKRY